MIKTTYYTIETSKEIKSNLKIAVLSDIHCKIKPEMIDIVKETKPDIIFIPGDLFEVTDNSGDTDCIEFLRRLNDYAPVYFSTGNHDGVLSEKLKTEIASSKTVFLDNSFVTYGDIYIGGLSSGIKTEKYPRTKLPPAPDTGFIKEFSKLSGFKILLCHHPEYYSKYIKNEDIDIIIAGHAHGGQWRIFGVPIFAPGQGIFPKFTAGIYDNRLIVSRGLADHNGIPRICNPKEILIISIKRQNL